jgi:membrane associated rhomboid family serine protease
MTWTLIGGILLFSLIGFFDLEPAVRTLCLVPADPWRHGGITYLTSFLLHADVFHLLGNLYFLYVFGDNVEDRLGSLRYLVLILGGAVVGDALHICFDPRHDIPLIGASGGISGVIAFYALRFPHARLVCCFSIWMIPFSWLRLPALAYFGIWSVVQLGGSLLQAEGASAVSYLAHVGGFGFGVAYWILYRQR